MNTPEKTDSQVLVYRLSKGWKLFFVICTPMMSVLFGWFMLQPFFEGRYNDIVYLLICLIIGGSGLLFFLYSFLSALKSRVEIHADRMCDVNLFNTKTIRLNEVKGFRVLDTQYVRTLVIVPKIGKKIKIALVVERKAELLEWVQHNFTDLDAIDYHEESERLKSNIFLGETIDQRLWLIERARKCAFLLNAIGMILLLWIIFKPKPYQELIWASMLFPLVSLGSIQFFKGAIKLDVKKNSPHPDVAIAVIGPILGLGMRSLDWNILHWEVLWSKLIFASVCAAALFVVLSWPEAKAIGAALSLIFFGLIYGSTSVVVLNGLLDTSTPSVFTPHITEKRVSTGKNTSYYFELSPWGEMTTGNEVTVRKYIYNQYKVGDTVDVVTRNGRFGAPWYIVR